MNNATLTADTPFYQSINYDHDARRAELATEQAYRDVWLYDRDDEARKRVEANTNAAMYALPSMQDKKGLALWGREHARMVAPHLADTPVELAQSMRDRLVDAGMKERYTAQMQELEASGQDSADDWYSLYAGMYRDVEQKAWDDARAREAAVADSLDRLGAYISGADLTPDEEEGKGFSQKDVDNVRSVLPAAEMAALDDMRAFARTYLRGLEQLEDGAAIVRGLDALEDELHELVGQDENKAALMYNTVMDWAQRVADSDKIGAGDEFLLSVENTWRHFGDAAELANKRYTAGGYRVTGAAGGVPMMVEVNADEQARAAEWLAENKKKALARGVLSAGAQKAREIGKNTGWWKSVMRTGAAMAGDTSMYLIPVAGQYLGTISTLAGGQDTYEQLQAGGKSNFAASVQAGVGTGVQAGVELLPFGKIGGKGLSAFVRKVFGESVAKGTSGALAKWVVRHTQKSTMRALAAEAGAGMVDEALIEPLVGGSLTLGLEEAVYAWGAPQGEQSRKWTEHFAELSSMLTDPQQLAGLAIFTAALTGASTPAIRRNVKYFERSRTMWEAAGLKPEQVEEVLVSKTPMQTGRELLEQEEAQDAAGLWERRAKANEKILAEGKVLFMTGQSEAEMEAPELAQAYAAAWQEGVQAGVLPEVKANEDGTFTVRERGKASKEDKVLVLTPAAADAYLQAAIEREEKAQFEQLKKELGEQGAREKAPNLRALVQIGVAEIAGEAMRRQVAKHGRFDVADVEKQLPEHLAKLVRMRGGIDRMLAARISDWARGRVAALMEGGMSERDAWASKDYAAGAVRSLGDWTGFAESFVHRTEKLANRDSVVTQVFRAQNNDVALVDGATVLGSTIFNVRGKGRAFGWLEDTTESVVDQLLQARGAKIYEAKQGEGMTREEAERQALNELGEQVARARAAVLKADPSVKVFEVKKDDRMSVIEAFSDISNSAFLTSGVVPKWMRPMAEMMKANVVAANTALTLAKAWEAAIEADPEAVSDMRKVLDEVGIDVRDIVEETNISAEDIETWKMARAEARAVAYGPRGVGGEAVSEVVQQAEAEEAAIRAKEAPVSEERKKEVQAEVRAQEEHVERVFRGGAMSKAEERRRDLTLENVQVSQEDALMHLAALEGKPLQNEQSGFVAVVNKPQRKELTNIGKALVSESNGYSVDAHYAAVVRIEKLFRYAIACGEYPDLKHRESTVHIHRFACPMMIDGEKAVAWFTAKQTTNVEGSERLYNLELTDIEKLAGTLEYLASHRLDTALPSASEDIVAQIEEAFKTYFEDVEEVSGGIGAAPEEVRGVFVGDSCVYHAAGGYYMGLIDKSKLRDGIEQVKVGAKGKHGVIAGRELVGDFRASAAPLYVWKRKNGELWLISGRHRFELLLRDNGVSSHACYVFVEDAEHDEKWARMMDYENNMCDDQADEVTAAMYVRETGYGDAELWKRGLLRNESRSKRGALIGRWAREELWTRFVNGAVKPMDAEIICNLTKNLRDASRVEEIQRRCCMLLDEGKGWEYIGAMVQLMANKESVFLKQGLLDLGADFEADLARAAAWIEKNLRKLNEAISLVKQGRKLSGKKREEAERLGIATQMEGGEDLLADLEGLRAKFEMVGSYPDLVAQAQLYDGKTEVDPVGQLLEQQRAQREREQELKELNAEAYLRAKQAEAVPTLSFSIFNERRWANDVWPTRAMKKIEADWLERLDAYIAEYQAAKANPNMKRPMGQEIYVCPTPGVLSLVGVTSRDVVTTRHALDHDMFTKHGMTRKALRHLPSAIANPICIAESQSVPGALEILTTLTETVEDSKTKALVKKNVLVALHVGVTSSTDRKLIVSKIASAYGKNNIRTIINKHKILYWNDQKGKVMLNDYRLQLPQAVAHDLSTGNIWDFNDLVKYKQENNLSFSLTPEMESIKADAVAAGTFMKAPNGKATNLTELQWLQVRTKAFKAWFGDWDGAADLTITSENGNYAAAKEYAKSLSGNALKNEDSGIVAYVNSEQRKELTHQSKARISQGNGFTVNGHYAVVMRIDKVFKRALYCGIYPDLKHNDPNVRIHRFASPIKIDGELGIAWMTAKETLNQEKSGRLYNLELLEINKLAGKVGDIEEHNLLLPPAASKEIVARVKALSKTYFENVSKVVDENGEPRVVYHGSLQWFQIFNDGKEKHQSGAPDGTIFANDNREIAVSFVDYYGGKAEDVILDANDARHARMPWGVYRKGGIYSLFMNLKNPLVVDFEGMTWHGEKYDIKDVNWYAVEARKKGHDGLIIRNVIDVGFTDTNDVPPSTDYVAFESNQVKSATDNRGTFDGSSGDITMSTEYEPRNLAAVHSIPVDTMLDVEKKLGGLPKPSIAITRLDKPYSWGYSERVYLIGKPELADPQKGNLVYDRDAWTGKGPFLLEGGGAYDYRKGEYFEPTLEEFVARTIKKKGQEDGSSFRGQSAVAIGTMDAVKAHREKLSDTDTANAQKAETDEALEELIENVVKLSKKGLNEDAVAMVLARVCWRSSPMNHGAPSEMKTSRDTAKRILNELGVRVKDIKKPLVDSFMKAVAGLQNELEDYLESVPQRAVMFNEWEYAVMPESMKGTPGLDEMLERNGIKPVWHDGTEGGRRAALAGLVDDSKVSFSVVGEHAANWDELKERAFKGRDDGKLRVELDASGAKLKGGKHGQDAKVLAPRFRALVEFIREKINANRRWNAVVTDWKDNVPSIDSWEEVSFVRRVLEKAGITYQNLGALVNSGILLAVLEPKEEHIGAFLDKVERIDSLSGFDALEDVLDYPELYKAYPQLRKVPILWKKDAANRGLTSLSGTGDLWITIRDGEDAERTLSTLLHETQHVIQFIEGFAVGGSGSFADMRAWMSDNGYLDQSLLLTNAELYRRLAGEIEARNVQKRAGWDANVRQYYIPFNDTLEYAGQAIVIKASDLGYDNVSLSLTVEAQNALHLLEKRRDEVEAQVILEDMQKACERLSVVLAADDDPQVGNGLQVYAEMQALISATRKALPGKYLRQGNLNGLLAWAGVYARMAQNGAMPKRGAIKGEIYDRFVTELGKKNERMQLQGMSADEAREVMMGLGSTRLEEAFLKVGRDCAKRLDAFLKDRALERIEYLHEMVYPKREPGQAWTRGKMDTTAYLLVEKVRAIIAGSRERRAKLEEELREKGREMRRVREAMESGQMEEELGARKLTVMRGQMELMELNAMAEAAAKHAKTLEQLDQELAELDQAAEDYAQREREINEEVALLKTFGNWYYKDAGEAVRAARVFEDIILRGKADWEDKLKLERERRAWLKAQIASHFTTADPDVENVRADDRAAFKGTMGSKAKAMAKGVMSFGHMLIYLRKKLGREFCDDQRAKLARIHDGFMGFNRELDGWMYRTLRDITGLDTKEAQEVWLTQMEEVNDTGIMVTNSRREKIVLSYAEAKRWLGLNKKAFEQERARMLAEAAQAKRKPMNVPTAEVMDELRELYLAYEADHRGVDEDKKQFHLTHEETWEEELRTTKGVLLFFLLTFEQPDYEHLLEANGMSGATLDQIRRYIGPTMVRWGYAMRNKLNEHGQLVAEVFERYTGIPFGARESYFKGVFDTGAMKERDERAAIEQGSAGAGTRTKYGSLIPRRYHKARVERVSATQVFVQAMQQQNNYVQTAEFVREWRGLLTDKEFAKRMEAELGADTMQMLRGCIETLEGAAAGDAAAARAATGVISKMLSGYAVTRLAGNVYSIIKQVSAILNAMAGGYVPEKMVEHGVLVQDMALRKVGFGEFLRSLARVLTLRGAIGKSEVARQEYILGRKLYEGKGLAHTAMLEANQKVAGYEPAGGWLGWTAVPNAIWSWLGQKSEKVKELGMEALGFMDAEMCTLSAMALADAVYRQGKAEDKEGLVPDELLRARALQLAGMALDIAAQPQVRTQKGYWAASGAFGALAPTLYMFRSDTLSKVGLWGAQMASGEKLPAATSFLAFGVLNALVLALLRMMRGDLPDDDDEVKEMAVEFALNVLTNDASSLPLVGETIGTLRNTLQGKHWAAQGGLGEMVLPFVTLGTDIYREVRNIDKDAPLDKHWATVGRLLRSLGASAAIFHESTTGPLANASSIAAAAAVAGNMSMVVKGLIKAMEDAED